MLHLKGVIKSISTISKTKMNSTKLFEDSDSEDEDTAVVHSSVRRNPPRTAKSLKISYVYEGFCEEEDLSDETYVPHPKPKKVTARPKKLRIARSKKSSSRVKQKTMMGVLDEFEFYLNRSESNWKLFNHQSKAGFIFSGQELLKVMYSPMTGRIYTNVRSDTPAFVLKQFKKKYCCKCSSKPGRYNLRKFYMTNCI